MKMLGTPYKKGTPCRDCPDHCNVKNKLCTNSCPFADHWVNCGELKQQWPQWVCQDPSKEGKRRKKHCRATCHCKNKIRMEFSNLLFGADDEIEDNEIN